MKRSHENSYQAKAIAALISLTGKPNKKQAVRKLKSSKLAMIYKMARYCSRAS